MADQPGPLDEAMREPIGALLDGEQLELIRDQVPGRDPALAVQVARAMPRGRGRPAGALNKRNAKLRDFILARYEHPAIGMAETYSRPVEALAAELGCTLVEAAKLQADARAELLPYIEGKMPTILDIRKDADMVVVMASGGLAAAQALTDQVNEGGLEAVDWSSADVIDGDYSVAKG